jgi:predicted anti-sigma-YlaC factor YlaD
MSCGACEDALSAIADGEPCGIAPAELEGHVAGCVACTRYRQLIAGPQQPTLTTVDLSPDMPAAVSRLVARDDRRASAAPVRYLLVALAISIMIMAVPELFASDASAAVAHADRHLGSFSVAYGVLLLVTAIRPARAQTALPVAVVLAAAIGITAIGDLVRGKVPLIGEALHLPQLLSVIPIWLLARRTSGRLTSER